MDISVKTPATLTSVPISLIRANRRMLNTAEDALLDFWIRAADAFVEKECNIALMEQTLVLRIKRVLPTVQLPRPPFKELVTVKYTVTGAVEVTAPAVTVYTKDMLPTFDIPALEGKESEGSMEIEYKAGHSTQLTVPMDLAHAVILLASHWSTSREAAFMDPRIMNVEKKIAFGVDEHLRHHDVRNNMTEMNGGY